MNGNVTCENCWWYGANEKAKEIIKKATNDGTLALFGGEADEGD